MGSHPKDKTGTFGSLLKFNFCTVTGINTFNMIYTLMFFKSFHLLMRSLVYFMSLLVLALLW